MEGAIGDDREPGIEPGARSVKRPPASSAITRSGA
jgi:hypothetical protein